jgi:uncharacterized FlgJ-related protein
MIRLFLIVLFLTSFTYVERLDHKSLYNEILEQNLEFPEVVFAQAILESNNFKSDICRNNYNLFGMRVAKSRKTFAIGKRKGYAKFKDYGYSISDYALYQEMVLKKKKHTKSSYIKYISTKYSRDPGYTNKIKKIMVKYDHIFYDTSSFRNDGIFDN